MVLKADAGEIEITAGKVIVHADSGDVSIEASGTILLGGTAATEAVIKGDTLYNALDSLVSILKTASLQTWGPGPIPIPCGPNPLNAGILAPVEALLGQIRSAKVKTA